MYWRRQGLPGALLVLAALFSTGVGAADEVLYLPECPPLLAPVMTSLPMQLLAYHVAVWRGTDVDQPRNLAKSVTVE